MPDRPLWFNACLVAAVFALILMPAAGGFGMFLVNLAAFACFAIPVVAAIREGEGNDTDFHA